jgi:hypothetical protein
MVKGWHDAGDFSLYSGSTNSALFWLLSAITDFSPRDDDTAIPASGSPGAGPVHSTKMTERPT